MMMMMTTTTGQLTLYTREGFNVEIRKKQKCHKNFLLRVLDDDGKVFLKVMQFILLSLVLIRD